MCFFQWLQRQLPEKENMSDVQKVTEELRGLGYDPFTMDTAQGQTVVIRYRVFVGKYKGEQVLLGFSFQEGGYPEYPPHWIHISPPYTDNPGWCQ